MQKKYIEVMKKMKMMMKIIFKKMIKTMKKMNNNYIVMMSILISMMTQTEKIRIKKKAHL